MCVEIFRGKMTWCLQFTNSSSRKGETKGSLWQKWQSLDLGTGYTDAQGCSLSVCMNISIIEAGNEGSLAPIPRGRRTNENHSHRGELGRSSYHVNGPHTHSLTWPLIPLLGSYPVDMATWLWASTVMVKQNSLNVQGQRTWEYTAIPI